MIIFKEFNEMASDTGTAPKDIFSLKNKLNISNLTLVIKKLPNKMSIYKDSNKYFLIQNKEYKGHIEFIKMGGTIEISASHSEIKKGFYSIMFTSILSETNITEILSDTSLSTQAIKVYENLNRKLSTFELGIKIGPVYKPFDKELLLSNKHAKVSIKAKFNFAEALDDYHRKLEFSETYRIGDKNNNGIGEFLLYHEGWDK